MTSCFVSSFSDCTIRHVNVIQVNLIEFSDPSYRLKILIITIFVNNNNYYHLLVEQNPSSFLENVAWALALISPDVTVH